MTCEGGTEFPLFLFRGWIFFTRCPPDYLPSLAPTGRKRWGWYRNFCQQQLKTKVKEEEKREGKKGEVSEGGRRFVMLFAGWWQTCFQVIHSVFLLWHHWLCQCMNADLCFSLPHLFLFREAKCSTQSKEFPLVKTRWWLKDSSPTFYPFTLLVRYH